MVSRDDIGLIFGGIIAATAVFGIVKSVQAGGGGGFLTATVHVTDQNGAPLAGAAVTFGASLPQTTDASGNATFTGFPSGTYQLIVTATGFQTFFETVNLFQSSTYPAQLMPNATCVPQSCTCGYAWNPNPDICSCVKQQVGSILGTPSLTFVQNWYSHINVGPGGNAVLCAGTTPDGDPGCNGTCGNVAIATQVTVKVTDTNGQPMCGVPVEGFLSATSIPWQTSDGQTWGHFSLDIVGGVNAPLYTDANGEVAFTVRYRIVVDGTKGYFFCLSCCGPSTLFGQNFPVLATFQVPGTSYKTVTSVSMTSSVYVYYYYTPITT